MSPAVRVLTLRRSQNGQVLLMCVRFKILLVHFCRFRIESDCIFRKTIKPSIKIVNFVSLKIGVLTLRLGLILSYSVNVCNGKLLPF